MRARGSARLCARSPQFQLFDAFCSACCCWCMYHVGITPSVKLSSSLLCGGHGTTAVEHQAFLRSRTVYQFARARASYVCYDNEHIISREVQGCCKGSRAIQTHTYVLPRDLKSNRAATVTTAAAALQASGVSWQPRRVFTCMCAVFTRRHLYMHSKKIMIHTFTGIYFHARTVF